MLCKEVCICCSNKYWPKNPWSYQDEYLWMQGEVICPVGLDEDDVCMPSEWLIGCGPPERCPYVTEHAVGAELDE